MQKMQSFRQIHNHLGCIPEAGPSFPKKETGGVSWRLKALPITGCSNGRPDGLDPWLLKPTASPSPPPPSTTILRAFRRGSSNIPASDR